MTSILPDDPYAALGVPQDASSATIKTAYRKLVLKHHPDKVQDDSLKQSAADLFHKIQSAWETIGDEDKRGRYDARCKLAALRKEAMDRDRAGDSNGRHDLRPSAHRTATESRSYPPPPSAGYRTEEFRPETDYFDKQRSPDRRDFEVQYDRPRRSPADDRQRASKPARHDTKESDRARQREKVRQSTKATTRDRDHKYAYSHPEMESDSDSDHYAERARRSLRERDMHADQARRRSEEASTARYFDERTSRMSSDAQDYMERMHAKRRPSPQRMTSQTADFVKGPDGRPVAFRRGSGRPKPSREDTDPSRRPRRDDRSSGEYDEPARRPPGLASAKSAPSGIHLPYDKPRANSAQLSREAMAEFAPAPIKRADSMPLQTSDRNKPSRASALRQTQIPEEYGSRSPSRTHPPPPPDRSRKEYADDYERPTPDGYIIETREPTRRTRSPEPVREKNRSSSTRYATSPASALPPLNTRTTSYRYSPQGSLETMASRPKLSRAESSRKDSPLFGEIPTSASPRDHEAYSASPIDSARYREVRPDYKMQSGRSTGRQNSDARSPYRTTSYSAAPSVSA